jgi:hypothetical protein
MWVIGSNLGNFSLAIKRNRTLYSFAADKQGFSAYLQIKQSEIKFSAEAAESQHASLFQKDLAKINN